MPVAIISLVISFILDGLMSNYLSFSLINPSLFKTIYTLVALVVLLPYFANQKKYLYLLVGAAILFDIVYTGTFILNIVIFFLIFWLNEFVNFFLSPNLLNTNIRSLLSVLLYHLLSFAILSIVDYNNFDLSLLSAIISHSILMTIIYTTILYLIISHLYDQFNIKQIK